MTTPEDGSGRLPMAAVNEMSKAEFVANFSGPCGCSWVAQRLAVERPHGSLRSMVSTLTRAFYSAPEEDQKALLMSFPERGDQPEGEPFDHQRATYQQRFGYPFIIAVKGRCEKSAVEAALSHRMQSYDAAELETALGEVAKLIGRRLAQVIGDGPGGQNAE
ncbi:2-oxo-4-hydroxy-4-carboxy-5-ureidoimidazoline decarboxylase [Acidisoma sp. S159]|uniref:2-oxo-4-hydroxy-4-carboxy-5-ureidoimidazoline decarboxylase n=1 Tax=Acidisoma sp. S159 TaxID=1747225 RepID=UPI00131CE43D|nr:2-oxo-4-hydroxy-4-carboxy-5-ureidoimidazoline decarboxylase [Acidisoma sp. S159]